MNESIDQSTKPCCYEDVKEYINKNPVPVILAAAGFGLLLAVLFRARKPARPEHRAIQILEDIQEQLHDLAEPVYRRAVSAADRGVAAVKEGAEHLGDIDLPSSFASLSRKLKQLFR